jgi:CheY-like chemotaxis protein
LQPEALAAAELVTQEISLLLTDVTMSGMDGMELGQRIHQQYSDMKMLSSSGFSADHINACNDADFLMKGSPVSEFLQRVRDYPDSENRPFRGLSGASGEV